MNTSIFDPLVAAGTKVAFQMRKKSPEILIGAGITGIVLAGLGLCKASMQVPDILEDANAKLDKVRRDAERHNWSEEEEKTGVRKVYFETGKTFVTIYAAPLTLAVLSIGCMVGSNRELKKRNAGLAGAYAALNKVYSDYRERVVERFGEDVDNELLHGIKKESIEVIETDEDGKEKKKKVKAEIATAEESIYLRYFTKQNPEWMSTDDNNIYKFKCVQEWANFRLKNVGFVTLNEVYAQLGMKETPEGMIIGWRYDKRNPSGDNMVILEWKKVYLPDEYGNYDEAWAIDFNVDGNIYKEMKERDLNGPESGDWIRDSLQFPKLLKGR